MDLLDKVFYDKGKQITVQIIIHTAITQVLITLVVESGKKW